MDSQFILATVNLNVVCHYFQLFDTDNFVNKNHGSYIFTTEGHILPLLSRFREGHFKSPTQPRSNVSVPTVS